MNRKAQVGAEYLIISGFLLFAILVFFAYSLSSYNEAASQSSAKGVVDSLANTASQLSGMGDKSSLTVDLEFPDGISGFQVSGRAVRLFVQAGSGVKEYYAESSVDLNSISLGTGPGFHHVKVSVNNGKVDFTES